jgi:hypothetical protein
VSNLPFLHPVCHLFVEPIARADYPYNRICIEQVYNSPGRDL